MSKIIERVKYGTHNEIIWRSWIISWIGGWCNLLDGLVRVLSLGLLNGSFTWNWLMYGLKNIHDQHTD